MTYSPSFVTRTRHQLAALFLELQRPQDPTDRAYLRIAYEELTAEYNAMTRDALEFS